MKLESVSCPEVSVRKPESKTPRKIKQCMRDTFTRNRLNCYLAKHATTIAWTTEVAVFSFFTTETLNVVSEHLGRRCLAGNGTRSTNIYCNNSTIIKFSEVKTFGCKTKNCSDDKMPIYLNVQWTNFHHVHYGGL